MNLIHIVLISFCLLIQQSATQNHPVLPSSYTAVTNINNDTLNTYTFYVGGREDLTVHVNDTAHDNNLCLGSVIDITYYPREQKCNVSCWYGRTCGYPGFCYCFSLNLAAFNYTVMVGPCEVNGVAGTWWNSDPKQIGLCIGNDNFPLMWIMWIDETTYSSFNVLKWIPGPPDSSVFNVPDYCLCDSDL